MITESKTKTWSEIDNELDERLTEKIISPRGEK